MKKILTFAMACAFVLSCFASSVVVNPSPAPVPATAVKASAIMLPVGAGKFASLQQLANISTADYEKLSGKKLRWIDRMAFKIGQRKLRNSINPDGTVSNKRLAKMDHYEEGGNRFHLGGFALGFLLGAIGVFIAFVINDEKQRRRETWAWAGLAIFIVAILVSAA